MSLNNEKQNFSLTITTELAGERADVAICKLLEGEFTRSKLKNCLTELSINNSKGKLSTILHANDTIKLSLLIPVPFKNAEPEDIPLNIIYEDKSIIVINKPWGMAVHPAFGCWNGTVVNALLHHCGNLPGENRVRPGIVHRLDKDTSGLMVCAKTDKALARLAYLFQERQVEKEYEAIIKGRPQRQHDIIEAPIGRHPSNRKKQAVVPNGKYAKTEYTIIKDYRTHSHLRVLLHTGRTHQIRVHLSHMRHPIVGDPIYARQDSFCDKLCLAAVTLGFAHPETEEPLNFEVPIPAHMTETLKKLEKLDATC